MLAAMVLGAEGVQMGSRFRPARKHHPISVLKAGNQYGRGRHTADNEATDTGAADKINFQQVQAAERGAGIDELKELLGRARLKRNV